MARPRMPQKPCKQCQTLFQPKLSKQQFCSLQCSADSRPHVKYQAMGQKGGTQRAKAEQARKVKELKALTEGMTPWEAFKEGAKWQLRRMNDAFGKRMYRKGYADGWDACTRELDGTSVYLRGPSHRSR